MLKELTEAKVYIPAKTHDMLPLASLRNLSTQQILLRLIVECYLHLALFPLLQVTHYAAPLSLTLDREGSLIVGWCVWL